jgi:trk system potassium uptake protein TrkH
MNTHMANSSNGRKSLSPAQILLVGYSAVIIVGTLLLVLPVSSRRGNISPLDAFFTATSATAVTGLTVVPTGSHFSVFGQVVILLLIQVGGLGIMTTSTVFALLLGRRIGIRQRLTIREDLGQLTMAGIVRLIKYILCLTFGIEFLGAVILFLRFISEMPLSRAAYFAVFHSISAFCNAGFDLFGDSLESFRDDLVVNLTILFLLVLGGLGFSVIADLYLSKFKHTRLSLHSKLVLVMTFALIFGGTVMVFILEYSNPRTIGELGFGQRLLASLFHGITPRTAGFDTISLGLFRTSTLFIMILLMFVGASPGSTGGGVKTTTFVTLILAVFSTIAGKEDVVAFEKRISHDTVGRALTVVMLASILIVFVTIVLTTVEDMPFIDILFETVSAFGTVGLSTGITRSLSGMGKTLIIITMFIGRVGPLTVAIALRDDKSKASFRYPEEKIMIG